MVAHILDVPLAVLLGEAVKGLARWNMLRIDDVGEMLRLDDTRVDGRQWPAAEGFDELLGLTGGLIAGDIPIVGIGHVDRQTNGHRRPTGSHSYVTAYGNLFDVKCLFKARSKRHHADGGALPTVP